MASGDQLNLRLEPGFVDKLEADAKRFGLKGKNSAATEIIETYYEHWRAMQEEMLRVRQTHLEKLQTRNQREEKQPEKRRAG